MLLQNSMRWWAEVYLQYNSVLTLGSLDPTAYPANLQHEALKFLQNLIFLFILHKSS